MKDFRVALVQMDSQQNKEENLRKMEERTSEAVQHGAVLVVFPETVEYIGPDMAGHASGVPGRITERFSDMARKNGVWLHAGSMRKKLGICPCCFLRRDGVWHRTVSCICLM